MARTGGGDNPNPYENARNQRLEENKRRFEDLGISKISKSLSETTNSMKKSGQQRKKCTSSRTRTSKPDASELRRSSRARNVVSYTEEVDMDVGRLGRSYLARPADEIQLASYEERVNTFKVAEEFKRNLHSKYPSFVKSMVRSHVYSCFWLGLPNNFCKSHLPSGGLKMVLEDEEGSEYDTIYIGSRTGLSGGWRGFALEHKLDDGDALVFELTEPARFKIYIFRAREDAEAQDEAGANKAKRMKVPNQDGDANITKSQKTQNVSSNGDEFGSGSLEQEGEPNNKVKRTRSKKLDEKGIPNSGEVQPSDESKDETVMDTTKARRSKRVASSPDSEVSVSPKIQPQVTDDPKPTKIVRSSQELQPGGESNNEIQPQVNGGTKFRKRSVSTKLFRKKAV